MVSTILHKFQMTVVVFIHHPENPKSHQVVHVLPFIRRTLWPTFTIKVVYCVMLHTAKVDGPCGLCGENRNVSKVLVGKPEGNSHLWDLGLDRREWTGLKWLRIGTSGRLSWTFRFHKMWGIWLPEDLWGSQEWT